MILTEIFGLIHKKGEVCVSVIVPTYKKGTEMRENRAIIKKAIHDLDAQLEDRQLAGVLVKKLQALASQINYDSPSEGAGFFVSLSTEKLFNFDFPVKKSIVIGENFEVRELVFHANQNLAYAVLLLSESKVHLYMGSGKKIAEVEDSYFPKTYKEQYEYTRTTLKGSDGSMLRATAEKSQIREHRLSTFFRSIDKALNIYMDAAHLLIIIGVEEEISLYKKLTDQPDKIIGSIHGNYEHMNPAQLVELIYPEIENYIEKRVNEVIKTLVEDKGRGMAVSGLTDVWNAAAQGDVRVMLVEKDFTRKVYRDKEGFHIHLKPKKGDTSLPDAVNELIEMTLEKEGEVLFTENGIMERFGHIACLLRYPRIGLS